MPGDPSEKNGNLRHDEEIAALRSQVEELKGVLDAITSGEVDAIVVTKGDQKKIYTLEGADYPYRILIENIGEGALTLSAEGMILYCNAAFAGMRELPLQEIPGTDFRDHVVPKDRGRISERFRSTLNGPTRCGIRVCSKNGSVPVLVSMTPLGVEGSTKISMVVADRRKDFGRLLLQGRMLDSVADAVIAADPEGKIMYWNDAATKTYGWRPDEAIGQDLFSLTVPDLFLADSKEIFSRLANGRSWWGERTMKHRDGYLFPVFSREAPVFDNDGNLIAIIAASNDIRDRKKAEQALHREMEKRDIIADAARLLLTSESPEQITHAICERLMVFLGCQVFFNYLIEDGRNRMRLNAYDGIADSAAEKLRSLDFGTAVCGCVGRDGTRIVAEDIQHTTDPRTDLVRSFGVTAYACHPLVYQEKTIGTLSFGTKNRPRFEEEELNLMAAVTDLVATAMARKKAELALSGALSEKEVLLSEIHHRVKNNLTAFIALLSLEGSYEETPAGQRLKKDLQNRARSMALIHDTLYRTGNFSRVDMNLYLTTLIRQIEPMYTTHEPVDTIIEADGVMLDLDRATPCGLIVNELFVNALKYAFPERAGTVEKEEENSIRIRMARSGGHYMLNVSDNGIGLPAIDLKTTKTLGLKLVNILASHQLRASVDINRTRGTEFRIRFKEKVL